MAEQSKSGTDSIEYLSVRISESSVAEMDGAFPAVEMANKDIQRLELMYGVAAERPVVQFTFGCALVLSAAFASCRMLVWLREGGRLSLLHFAVLTVALLGAWCVKGAFTRRHFLRVVAVGDTRKLVFRGKVDEKELGEFLRKAREGFRYRVTSTLPGVRP